MTEQKQKGRRLYREVLYRCGQYIQGFVYPVFQKQRSRGPRRQPTSEAQKKLNDLHAEQKLVRLINTNFTDEDIRLDLTYNDEHLPQSVEDAQREVQNFLRRLKNYRKRHNLPELKYVWVTEVGSQSGRIHHHCIMSGGVDVSRLSKMWGRGYTTVKPLVLDVETGATAIAKYLIKRPVAYKRWNASKNLKQPEVITRDGQISRKTVEEWEKLKFDAHAEIEKRYGYKLANIQAFYNDRNTGCYLWINGYKLPEKRRRS